MKYLERVIKEALRLFPSVPFIGRTLTEATELGELMFYTGISVISIQHGDYLGLVCFSNLLFFTVTYLFMFFSCVFMLKMMI